MSDLGVRESVVRGGIGQSPLRPDGVAKSEGSYAFSSDLSADNMLIGKTLRSPHQHARILRIDTSKALAMNGVHTIITADDVPGKPTYGLISSDQPVFANDVVRYIGEPIAAVVADDEDICARALAAIEVEYEVLPALTDARLAANPTTTQIHPEGNVIREQNVICGDLSIVGDVIVEDRYTIGMQDQAFLGLEAALAIPDPDGVGVECHVATQWLHEDLCQIAACLNLPETSIRLVLGGVGGAFGGREDISLQVHVCLLALATGRPVKMHYSRSESFLGHVHRHPAEIWMRHHATNDGRIVKIEAEYIFDGGAYASTSSAVLVNAVTHTQGPYKCENAHVRGVAVRTNNLPCGAMRGFGVVQACFAHERQMDLLAEQCNLDPLEIRRLNAMTTGDRLITGQVVESVAPVSEIISGLAAMPEPPAQAPSLHHPYELPGGAGNTTRTSDVIRGVGYGLAIKNLMYSEAFDDYSTARCMLSNGIVTLKVATAEVGQGCITIAPQIARTTLGLEDVRLDPIDTGVGSAGSTSASRQTWMSGGAVEAACLKVRQLIFEHVAASTGCDAFALVIEGQTLVDTTNEKRWPMTEIVSGLEFDEEVEFRHRPTVPLDENGQGDCHTAFAFVGHRAVVDVDVELGLVRVVEIATVQDVGRALNPLSVIGQIEGGIAQGLGLALMEEIIQRDGRIMNPSFTDYLIPTIADMPPVNAKLIEIPDPQAPMGAKGVGEPPTISSTPAIIAAIQDAMGRSGASTTHLTRVPIRPSDIAKAVNSTLRD
ncbi:MAG: xanthine dehydrogenase subunit D [Ilumatobacteraceae bacterium]